MDMQNHLFYLAGKRNAFKAMQDNSKFWQLRKNGYIDGVLDGLNEEIDSLERLTGLRAPIKDDKVVPIQHRQVAR